MRYRSSATCRYAGISVSPSALPEGTIRSEGSLPFAPPGKIRWNGGRERRDGEVRWLRRIRESADRAFGRRGSTDPAGITGDVLLVLGIPAIAVNPLDVRSNRLVFKAPAGGRGMGVREGRGSGTGSALRPRQPRPTHGRVLPALRGSSASPPRTGDPSLRDRRR